ncbi:MAG: fructose-6-phosphate aldolase [Candidatus Zixiibacteriota bacterium]
MKFFLDTANLEQIKTVNSWGLLDGITTNPSLISKEDGEFKDIIEQICNIVDGPISAEVMSENYDGMLKEAHELSEIHTNVVIKLPFTQDGVKATKTLSDEGIGVNLTLVFNPIQALIGGRAGAKFISPFVGRLDDISTTGMNLVADIVQIYNNYGIDTEIIVASIRSPMHIYESALLGADICTIPFAVMQKLFNHPLTDIGIERFKKDWGDRQI